jgi:hypothetical protein
MNGGFTLKNKMPEIMLLVIFVGSLILLGAAMGQLVLANRACKVLGYDEAYVVGNNWVCAEDAPHGEVVYFFDLLERVSTDR